MTWGSSLTFSMKAGSHAIVFINHTAVFLWLSGGGLEFRTLFGVVDFISFTANENNITVSVTETNATITAYFI